MESDGLTTMRQLAERALAESRGAPSIDEGVTAGAVRALLAGDCRLTGKEIAFALGFGREAKHVAFSGGVVTAILTDLVELGIVEFDLATARYFLRQR